MEEKIFSKRGFPLLVKIEFLFVLHFCYLIQTKRFNKCSLQLTYLLFFYTSIGE